MIDHESEHWRVIGFKQGVEAAKKAIKEAVMYYPTTIELNGNPIGTNETTDDDEIRWTSDNFEKAIDSIEVTE